MNDEIRSNEVRVVDSNGKQLGVMSTAEARKLALEAGVDLVEISPSTNPPVVKIIDWGKYQYHKLKEQKKSKSSELKQMRLGLKIGSNDLDIKIRKIKKFLADGDRVKIMVVFKGREMAHKELGFDLMEKVLDMLSDVAVTADQKPQMAGRNLSINIRRK
ncbi:MAG: translation initiation factor IF-3 [Candidatus Nomurabacteria bacterium]|nr:translation initiation factor IF-3 [Candidatus Nomurabacteria bacterium]